MIAVVLALQVLGAATQATVEYDEVPAEVVRIEVVEWLGGRPGAPTVSERVPGRVRVKGSPHRIHVVLFARADGWYLVDGPFPWPAGDGRRAVSRRWHRTLRGDLVDDSTPGDAVDWIGAGDQPSPWPMCFREGQRSWSCWGMAPETAGVVVASTSRGIQWTIGSGAGAMPMRRAGWGRLIVVSDAAREPVRANLARPVAAPSNRAADVRLATAIVTGARAIPVTGDAIWVAADEVPPKAWVEVATKTRGPVFLPLEDVAAASASVPLHVALPERRAVSGRVVGSAGEPASGALVATFRLIDPPRVEGRPELPRRVLAAETVADADGRFEIDGLGEADYEIVAWHSHLGRVSVPLPVGSEIVVRLRAAGIARGRVVAGGRPVADVAVISVPDATAFASAADITAVKGGDTRTGADGRFSVIVADSGGGELRIGGGTLAVRRVALPRPPLPVFDVGDIDLGASLSVTVVLDRDPQCVVRAAGPAGRSGLQVILGDRDAKGGYGFTLPEAGLWEFTLACVGQRHTLSPALVEIGPAHAGQEFRFVVR